MKSRLYAAKFSDMNDPMEGHYIYSPNSCPQEIIDKIKGRKKNIRIVSLSRSFNNFLMWSHYADGHRGIAIGIDINREVYKVRPVNYIDRLTSLKDISSVSIDKFSEKVLSQKLSLWSYEEEERVFVEGSSTFIDVTVKQVIIGKKMSTQNYSFLKELIHKVNPDIEVIKIEVLDNNFDYNVDDE